MGAQYPEVTSVEVKGHYRLHVGFNDGAEGDVDVSDLRDAGGVFEPLRDPAFFALASVDANAGTITWPNGADLAPEVLYAEVGRRRGGRHYGGGAVSAAGAVLAVIGAAVGIRVLGRTAGKP
jgi:Protein of unknown function (DUF2442)